MWFTVIINYNIFIYIPSSQKLGKVNSMKTELSCLLSCLKLAFLLLIPILAPAEMGEDL